MIIVSYLMFKNDTPFDRILIVMLLQRTVSNKLAQKKF